MGDCAGSPQFTHVGVDDYRIVQANLSGGNRTTSNRLIPFCMLTDPELARVGKNEVEARREGIEYWTAKLPMAKCSAQRRSLSSAASLRRWLPKIAMRLWDFPAFGFEASELMVAMQTAMLAVMLLVLVSQTQQQSEVKMVKAAAYARDYPNRLDGHHPCPSNLELERQG